MVRVSLPTICVVPNVEKRYNSMRVLRAVGVAIAILAFVGVIVIMAISFTDTSNGMLMPFIPIPMLCIMAGMLILAFGNYKAMQYARVKAAVNTIKSRDKILLLDVFSMESNSLELAQAMLDTGNLPGYELVGSVMLAKTELHVSEEEAVAEHNARLQSMQSGQHVTFLRSNAGSTRHFRKRREGRKESALLHAMRNGACGNG